MSSINIERTLTNKGVKPTPNRILVARALIEALHPLSLADLEIALEFTIEKPSIFRVLELFTEKDVVHAIEDGSRSLKYEWCQSESHLVWSDEHVHFYCERCKETFCFEQLSVPIVDIPESFAPRSINYMIKGLCPNCARLKTP